MNDKCIKSDLLIQSTCEASGSGYGTGSETWFSILSVSDFSPRRSESRSWLGEKPPSVQQVWGPVQSRSRPESRSSHEEVDQTPLFLPAMCEEAERLEHIMRDIRVKILPEDQEVSLHTMTTRSPASWRRIHCLWYFESSYLGHRIVQPFAKHLLLCNKVGQVLLKKARYYGQQSKKTISISLLSQTSDWIQLFTLERLIL